MSPSGDQMLGLRILALVWLLGACQPTSEPVQVSRQTAALIVRQEALHGRLGFAAVSINFYKVMLIGGYDDTSILSDCELYDNNNDGWTVVAPLNVARKHARAVALESGLVFVVGGEGSSGTLASAEMYDPGLAQWIAIAPMSTPRSGHALVLLPDGRIVAFGGSNHGVPLASTEIYDPGTDRWTAAGPMNTGRVRFGYEKDFSGRLWVFGGATASGVTASVERFDIATSSWTQLSPLAVPRADLTVVSSHWDLYYSLASYSYLVGGSDALGRPLRDVERFDFGNQIATSMPPMAAARKSPILWNVNAGPAIAGGEGPDGALRRSVEVYDLVARQWKSGGQLPSALSDATNVGLFVVATSRSNGLHTRPYYARHESEDTWREGPALSDAARSYVAGTRTATTLPDGRVLVVGLGTRCEIINSEGTAVTLAASLPQVRTWHSATSLNDGRVFVAGGMTESAGSTATTGTTLLYNPAADTWTPGPTATATRRFHVAVRLKDGRVLVAGGGSSSAAIFDPTLNRWSVVDPMTESRDGAAAVLLDDGRVLVAGGCSWLTVSHGVWRCSDQSTTLATAELFDPGTRSWTALGTMPSTWTSGGVRRAFGFALARPGGRAIIGGQAILNGSNGSVSVDAEPLTSAFTPGPDALSVGPWTARNEVSLAGAYQLSSGLAVIAGGVTAYSTDLYAAGLAQIFEPDAELFTRPRVLQSEYAELPFGFANPSITALGDHSVIALGGLEYRFGSMPPNGPSSRTLILNLSETTNLGGIACDFDSDCVSGHCADGVCCDQACNTPCMSCRRRGHVGLCSALTRTSSVVCDDGNSNTTGDACTAGVCAGVDHCLGVTCTASDQCHSAGACIDHATGACSNPAKANGAACVDGNANTVGDNCTAGTCAGTDYCVGVTCTASDQCHSAGTCIDHATGACSNPAKANGAACDDSNANTTNDACSGGLCVGVDRCVGVTCTASDACHVPGLCDHDTGVCSTPAKANGSVCDDGNPNTTGDTCTAGACAGLDRCLGVTCTASDQCHNAGTCIDHATGACSNPAKANGAACSDGNANTVGDICTSGTCAGMDHCVGVTCAASDQCHMPGACIDHATGACSNPPKANGTTCDDGNANTTNDACSAGLCGGVDRCVGVTCTASDACHVPGLCNHDTGTCSTLAKANGSACDDGDPNTAGDTCTAGVCAGLDRCLGVTCTASDQCHSAGTCSDHATGACSNPAKANGAACDDGNANTTNDACSGGLCGGVDRCVGVTCTASDACHVPGLCDHDTGVCSTPAKANGSVCDDGNPNTTSDTCTAGVCAGLDRCLVVTCTASDQCHSAGTCIDHATGACSNPAKANGAACSDGNANTVGDICTAGTCAGMDHCVGVTCTASDQCHLAGACIDHTNGACSNPPKANGTTCDDGNVNTTNDACSGGLCGGVDRCVGVTCTASDACHVPGLCNHDTGSCSTQAKANGSACDDGNPNTAGDACTAGVCAGLDYCLGVTCTASDQCHSVGTCLDHATGACSNPAKANGAACDDGDANTTNDSCVDGLCNAVDHCAGVTCTASDACHAAGSCNPNTGVCSNPARENASACDDGNPNTADDRCTAGACAGIDHCIGVTCAASDQCHLAGTCVDHTTGACSNPTKANGTTCDDGNASTTNDTCSAGLCGGVDRCVGVTCTASDACHVPGLCNHDTGTCSTLAKANGSVCDDGDPNTADDTCTAGVCAGLDYCLGITCAPSDQCHSAGTCIDRATGACSSPAKANGTACDDGNARTKHDVCHNGLCGVDRCAGVTCAANDACHSPGSCNHDTGVCTFSTRADGSPCNDTNPNTVGDVCTAGVCSGVDACLGVTCSASDECHREGFCIDHTTGACSNPKRVDGWRCELGVCVDGVCEAEPASQGADAHTPSFTGCGVVSARHASRSTTVLWWTLGFVLLLAQRLRRRRAAV